jgi:hypothetical protein
MTELTDPSTAFVLTLTHLEQHGRYASDAAI